MKVSPSCAEEIRDAAVVCRYCGRDVGPGATPPAPPAGPRTGAAVAVPHRERTATWRAAALVVLGVAVFAFLAPSVLDLFDGEGSQVVVICLGATALGYSSGHLLPGLPRAAYLLLAAAAGLAVWLSVLRYASANYPGAPVFATTWFVRFGLVTALTCAGGALLGDLVARRRSSLTNATIATLVSVAGLLLAVFERLS